MDQDHDLRISELRNLLPVGLPELRIDGIPNL